MRQILGAMIAGGLVGSAVVCSLPVQAIPEAQIIEKIQSIPVFTITDKNGAPLTAAIDGDPKKGSYVGVYLSLADAQTFLQKLMKEKPDLGKQLQTQVVPLSEMYKLQVAKKLDIAFVPSQQQVKTALELSRRTDSKIKQFNGVPLFIGRAGSPKGYIVIDYNKKKVIPLFFDREQLQPYLDKFKKDNPKLASTTEIQVITLEGFLDSVRSNNNPLYEQILIFPSREGLEVIRSQQQKKPR